MDNQTCTICNGTNELPSYDPSYRVICYHNGHVGFVSLVKRVERRDGRGTSPVLDEQPIGWFHINNNWWGWTLSELSDYEQAWLASQNTSSLNVYRTVSENGNQNIVCLRFDKGTFAFMDGEHLRETDQIRWQKFTAYTKVYIDADHWNTVLGE